MMIMLSRSCRNYFALPFKNEERKSEIELMTSINVRCFNILNLPLVIREKVATQMRTAISIDSYVRVSKGKERKVKFRKKKDHSRGC